MYLVREMGDNNSKPRIVPAYVGISRRPFNVLDYTENGESIEYFIPKEFGDAFGLTNSRMIARKWCPNRKRIGDFDAVQFGPHHCVFNDPKLLLLRRIRFICFYLNVIILVPNHL